METLQSWHHDDPLVYDLKLVGGHFLGGRRRELLQHIVNGIPSQEICQVMGVNPQTIKNYNHMMFNEIEEFILQTTQISRPLVHNKVQALLELLRIGELVLEPVEKAIPSMDN